MCSEFATEEDVDAATEYINRMADEAKILGFSLSYMKSKLYSVHADIIAKSESEAQVDTGEDDPSEYQDSTPV